MRRIPVQTPERPGRVRGRVLVVADEARSRVGYGTCGEAVFTPLVGTWPGRSSKVFHPQRPLRERLQFLGHYVPVAIVRPAFDT